jgi:hypothetical protein
MRRRFHFRWLAVVAAVAVVAVASALVVPIATRSGSALAQTSAISTNVGPRASAASSTPCNFQGAQTCQSTDPTVTVSTYQGGDTSACTFVWYVNWGDGQKSWNLEVVDPPDGWRVLAQHTYAAPGTYTIGLIGTTAAGNCTTNDFSRTFTFNTSTKPTAPARFTFAVNPITPDFTVSELIQGTNWPPGLTVHVKSSPSIFLPTTATVGQDGSWKVERSISTTVAVGNYKVTAEAQGTVNGTLTKVVVVHQLPVVSLQTQVLKCGLSPEQLVPFPTSLGDLLTDIAHLSGVAATVVSCVIEVAINMVGGIAP